MEGDGGTREEKKKISRINLQSFHPSFISRYYKYIYKNTLGLRSINFPCIPGMVLNARILKRNLVPLSHCLILSPSLYLSLSIYLSNYISIYLSNFFISLFVNSMRATNIFKLKYYKGNQKSCKKKCVFYR